MSPSSLVFTGATRGIGRAAALRIASANPDVHLVLLARGSAGTELVDEVRRRGANATAVAADLSSMTGVREGASRIATMAAAGEVPSLGGILANAGIQHTNAVTATRDDFEETFAVNVLANHLLIRLLSNHLRPNSRITLTTSDTHFGDLRHNLGMVPAPAWHHPDQLARPGAFPAADSAKAGRTAYSTSKLAVIYLVHEFARRLPDTVDIVSYNPGFVPNTGLARHADPVSRFVVRNVLPALTLTPVATTVETAARLLVATAMKDVQASTGDYVDRGIVTRSSEESYDLAREEELFATADRLLYDAGHLTSS
ncbi:SDR family NAD(P)-dependent oxidoreductase [Williamsia muralis]|uniref:SDR family NAD(P)-dependent oxidoreductase n=1 Tax=Williamsia marianensis TaxID=85044 RepID=A0ABU4EUD5_WILMA|nr:MULTISPECIES: SDR family NAD(P)-dependent oxidoreductase [Williamsia]MDV7134836.1 SDR family NAD(P)-dependent oxidoreductase [Williamsia muralis]PVY27381.1 NAD(P)-dependent dehydrogenase (short-subunit alcohol dehydrogenase family) [Williamsia marianensis]